MYDRQVRRRRAVLLGLVLCCLVLLTAYFGESSGGPLRSVQTGAMEVVAPVQEGANRALKPFRDLFGWFGDTVDAKGERDKLEAERDQLRQELARLQVYENENRELRDLVDYGRDSGLDAYEPVTARVYSRSNSTWYSTMEINKGSSDGVAVNQPVINGKGLVGKVKTRLGRQRGRDAALRLGLRRLRARRPGQPARLDPARRRLARRPAARPRARGQGGPDGRHGRDGRAPSPTRLPVAVPAEHPDRPRQARSRARASWTARSTSRRSPTCAASTSSRSSPSRPRTCAPPPVRRDLEPRRRRPPRRHRTGRRDPAADHGLAGRDLRRPGRPHAAARRRDRAARAARSPARASASASACSRTRVLAQTMGLTSLVLLGVGYAAGRLRELRDPAHGLVPVAVGAAATAAAAIGFARAAVPARRRRARLAAARAPDPARDRAQHAAGDAGLPRLPPRAGPVPARRSAPPPPPRVHHGRPEPAERRRQRQPRRRPGRPAGDAAAARHRVRGDRQRRPRRHAAPRPAGRGRRRAASSRRSASPPSGASTSTRRRSSTIRDGPARRRGRGRAARRPTCSPASRTPSTARRAPPSARRTPTSPGTPATSTTRSSRSSSW